MKRIRILILCIVFPLISFGLALFLTILRGAPFYTFTAHSFRFQFPQFYLFFLGSLSLLLLSWWALAKIENKYFPDDQPSLLWENFLAYLPFGFSLFSPLLLRYYLTSDDLEIRLGLLAGAMVAGFISVKSIQWFHRGRLRNFLGRSLSRFSRFSLKKRLFILFLIAFAVYHLCALCFVSKGLAFSGDEPYYLMTTHSLYQDGDINLAKNYLDNDYFHFYPRELFPNLRLRAYARFGIKGTDYVWPINQPGVSVLMLPYYWVSQQFQGRTLIYILKISLAVWTILLGLQVYLFATDFWKNEKISLILWFLYSFTAPILFYAIHLYPEIPIAFFSLYVYRKVRSTKRLTLLHIFFLGLLLALFPWFGLKYSMILWPMVLVSLYFLWKNHKARWKVIGFLAFPVVSTGLFALYIHELYGTFSPMAIYEGVLTPEKILAFREMIMKIPLMLRIDSFLDYFLDQRDGLLLYAPVYFFIFLGAVEAFRRSKKDLLALLFISLPYLLNYAFLSHRQGHSPQGRVLVNLSWIAVIFVGYFLVHNRKKLYAYLFWGTSLAGLIIAGILLQNPQFLYQPTTHEFTFRGSGLSLYLSNLNFYLPALLPSFIKVNNIGYIPNYLWLAAIALFIAGYVWKGGNFRGRSLKVPRPLIPVLLTGGGIAVFFLWFVLFPRTVLVSPVRAAYSSGERISFYDLGPHVQMKEEEPGRFTITKDNHALDLYFSSWRKLENLEIEFGTLEGEYRVTLEFFDEELFSGIISQEMKTVVCPSLPSYRFKNANLYGLRVEIQNLSDISTAENPFLLILQPVR
jgi:hypothetical protein